MTVWIWADLHLGHANIIKYENRPFSDVFEMNSALIEAWKKKVSPKDTVFILGDFSFFNKEETTSVVRSLPGFKYLILGNHDRSRSVSWWKDVGFDEVSKYPIIYEDFFILSHEPVYINDTMPYVNIHGHTHSATLENSKWLNVCVEHTEYKPVNFEDIKKFVLMREGIKCE